LPSGGGKCCAGGLVDQGYADGSSSSFELESCQNLLGMQQKCIEIRWIRLVFNPKPHNFIISNKIKYL
jgi:hypothetical protein